MKARENFGEAKKPDIYQGADAEKKTNCRGSFQKYFLRIK